MSASRPFRLRAATATVLLLAVVGPVGSLQGAVPAGSPAAVPAPPDDIAWPDRVFSTLDSFLVNYDDFFHAHFDTVDVAALPTWLDAALDSLADGDAVLARMVVAGDNEDEDALLARLLALVSRVPEAGLSQFALAPMFPQVDYVLGHEAGVLTLVTFDGRGVQETLRGGDVVRRLADANVFLTRDPKRNDVVVVTGGNLRGVEIWQPKLAREVMHTHTISGNIRPTGFPEYTEGSDRDMVLSNQRFQRPVYQYVLSPREPNR